MPYFVAVRMTRIRTDEAMVYVQVNDANHREEARIIGADAAQEWGKSLSAAQSDALFHNVHTEYEGWRGQACIIDAGPTIDVTV